MILFFFILDRFKLRLNRFYTLLPILFSTNQVLSLKSDAILIPKLQNYQSNGLDLLLL